MKRLIKLINNERNNIMVTSPKASNECSGDSTAVDYCSLIDNKHCSTYAFDQCRKDYGKCSEGADDYCGIDYDSCSGAGQTDAA